MRGWRGLLIVLAALGGIMTLVFVASQAAPASSLTLPRPNDPYRIAAGTNHAPLLSGQAATALLTPAPVGFDCSRADPAGRPVLSGAARRLTSPHAIVHYTLTGADATTPAYAQALSEAVERSLAVQFNRLGWRRLPADCGLGGDDRLDVYVRDIAYMAMGYAHPEAIVGDNPHTPESELHSAFGYLVIENDMDFLDAASAVGYHADPLKLARLTAAHEAHHAIQFGYDAYESFFGFYESGAMWIETLVFPELTDAYEFDGVLREPDLCLGSRQDATGLRIYGEWLLIDSLARDLGPQAYQRLWAHLAVHDGVTGFFDGLARQGTTIEDVIGRIAIRNLLLDYDNGERFAQPVTVSGDIRQPGTVNSGERGTQQQAVDYLRVAPGVWDISVRSGKDIRLRLVGVDQAAKTATSFNLGTRGTVDTRPFSAAYLIVQNTRRHQRIEDCYFTIWALSVRDGTGQPLTPPDADIWDASRFRAAIP